MGSKRVETWFGCRVEIDLDEQDRVVRAACYAGEQRIGETLGFDHDGNHGQLSRPGGAFSFLNGEMSQVVWSQVIGERKMTADEFIEWALDQIRRTAFERELSAVESAAGEAPARPPRDRIQALLSCRLAHDHDVGRLGLVQAISAGSAEERVERLASVRPVLERAFEAYNEWDTCIRNLGDSVQRCRDVPAKWLKKEFRAPIVASLREALVDEVSDHIWKCLSNVIRAFFGTGGVRQLRLPLKQLIADVEANPSELHIRRLVLRMKANKSTEAKVLETFAHKPPLLAEILQRTGGWPLGRSKSRLRFAADQFRQRIEGGSEEELTAWMRVMLAADDNLDETKFAALQRAMKASVEQRARALAAALETAIAGRL